MDAATVDARGETDLQSLLQRLQPLEGEADAGISLSGGDLLEDLILGTAEVHDLHIQAMLVEVAAMHCDRD